TWITGIVLMVLTGAVVLGGIRRIGAVAEWLVPFMCIGYILSVGVVLYVFADRIPEAFATIFTQAFNPTAATGGFVGSTVMMAI
ncbi:MAG: alanine:cation symporter family protein, partial [Thauera sp.]|nr:alanine:cation symporter family protein [Thauera sp.]